jgi:hypothetical protein
MASLSSSSSSSIQDGARTLLQFLVDTAENVRVVDEANGQFGNLYEPEDILGSLVTVATTEINVGIPSLPPPVICHSVSYNCTPYLDLLSTKPTVKNWHEIPVQVHNSLQEETTIVRIRWISKDGYYSQPSHTWNLCSGSTTKMDNAANKNWIQYCSPGDFFLFSIITKGKHNSSSTKSEEETILGAYRPLRPLPSGLFHSIVIGKEEGQTHDNYVIEIAINDTYDALCVAAASLDPYYQHSHDDKKTLATRIKFLTTILTNLVQHPNEQRYQKLKLSNPKIQTLIQSWSAMQILALIGFERRSSTDNINRHEQTEEKEEILIVPKDLDDYTTTTSSMYTSPVSTSEETNVIQTTRSLALQLLEILSSRCSPSFVHDLAPPTPWEPSQSTAGGSNNQRWGETRDSRRRGFITDEERWARAERVAQNRRSGRGRRPDPGNAPSSRGKWGR